MHICMYVQMDDGRPFNAVLDTDCYSPGGLGQLSECQLLINWVEAFIYSIKDTTSPLWLLVPHRENDLTI